MQVFNEAVPVTMDLTMKYFLLDDATLRDWNYMGLPGTSEPCPGYDLFCVFLQRNFPSLVVHIIWLYLVSFCF